MFHLVVVADNNGREYDIVEAGRGTLDSHKNCRSKELIQKRQVKEDSATNRPNNGDYPKEPPYPREAGLGEKAPSIKTGLPREIRPVVLQVRFSSHFGPE